MKWSGFLRHPVCTSVWIYHGGRFVHRSNIFSYVFKTCKRRTCELWGFFYKRHP